MFDQALEISLKDTRVISRIDPPEAPEIATLFRLSDGKILLGFELEGPATGYPSVWNNLLVKAGSWLKSLDGGNTWFFSHFDYGYVRAPIFQFDDGEIILFIQDCLVRTSGEVFTFCQRSTDNGQTFKDCEEALISLPKDLVKTDETKEPWVQPHPPHPTPGRRRTEFFMNRSIIQLTDGDLLASLRGAFIGDRNWRNVLITSSDRGSSWSYLSTIAADPQAPPEVRGKAHYEGFDEAAIAVLPDGELLTVMRTGSGLPLYQSRSVDGGETWSTPVRSGGKGVYPELLLMSSGILACSYGRVKHPPSTGAELIFSTDLGATWGNRTVIYDEPCEAYTAMLEVNPGELLFLYDTRASDPRVSNQAKSPSPNCIMAVNVEVKSR